MSTEESLQAETGGVWKPNRDEWLIFSCLAVIAFVVSLDTTILSPALPVLETSLHGDTTKAFWTGTAYLLSSSVSQLLLMDLSDVFGRRPVLTFCVASFTLGSILCSVSHGFELFLAGRSLQGIGGGGITTGCAVVVTDIVPLRSRPMYSGIAQTSWALGTITGPLVGGAIAQNISWRWLFYINFPICAIALVMVPLTIRLRADRGDLKQQIVSIDWFGAFLFATGLCLFLIGLTWGGSQFPWGSWQTVVPITVGAAILLGSLLWEGFVARRPFFDLNLFRHRSSAIAYGTSCLHAFLTMALVYFIPLFLQGVQGLTPFLGGVGAMVLGVTFMPSSVVTGIFITKSGRYRWAIWIGWAMMSIAHGLLTLIQPSCATYAWVLLLIYLGIGYGMSMSSLNFAAQAVLRSDQHASSSSMYYFLRAVGMCLGVALPSTFFQNRLAVRLVELELPASVAREEARLVKDLQGHVYDGVMEERYIGALSRAFRDLWYFLLAISLVCFFLCLLVRHASLDRELESDHVLVKDEPKERHK